jgi:23S rRNA (uridine2552-2'-O)-methyltransferase
MKKRSQWMHEHLRDEFVLKAQQDGYASRAAYKLLGIQEQDQILRPGMTVVDLGAAPGGWSQVASKLVGPKGRVIAIDLLPMDASGDFIFIQGDFTDDAILEKLMETLDGQKVDVILSDMSPNLSGQRVVDQPRVAYLVELALDCVARILKPGGTFVTKFFQGEGIDSIMLTMKHQFKSFKTRKPKASRSKSREIYLLGKGFLG